MLACDSPQNYCYYTLVNRSNELLMKSIKYKITVMYYITTDVEKRINVSVELNGYKSEYLLLEICEPHKYLGYLC